MFGGNFDATGVDDNSVEVESVAVAIADAGANVYRPGDSEQLHHEERQQMSDDHRAQAWCDMRWRRTNEIHERDERAVRQTYTLHNDILIMYLETGPD